MTAKDQAIAPDWDEAALVAKGWQLQDCKVCGESASAYVSPPAPDCRTCTNYAHDEDHPQCKLWNGCTNGDQYQPAPKVVLWRTE